MGLVQQQYIHDYWTKDEVLVTKGYTKKQVLAYHVISSPEQQRRHNTKRTRSYFLSEEGCQRNFQELYYPGENIAIDEGMIASRGHLSFLISLW